MEIGKVEVDFGVFPDYDPKYLMVADKSQWFKAQTLPSVIEVIPPGSTKPITNTFQKDRINAFTSVNLGLSCLKTCGEQTLQDLQDGIWTITVKSGYEGIEKQRYFLKTDLLRRDIDEAYAKHSLEYDMFDKEYRENLSDMEFLLSASQAHIRRGDIVRASRDYNQAVEISKKYLDCKNCK